MRQRNYGFDRRRKEEQRRAKQEAKQRRKSDREASGLVGPEMGEPQDLGASPDRLEWFSPSRGRTLTTEAKARPPVDPPDDWILLTNVADADTGQV